MADVLATGRPCCPSAVGMRQTITVLSMLLDTSMESSGDLSPKRSNKSCWIFFDSSQMLQKFREIDGASLPRVF